MNFIKKNKILVSLIVIAVVFLTALLIIIFSNLSIGNNEYGNRLDGIENYPISEEVINDIKAEILSFANVEQVNYNLEGRLANFIINVDDTLIESDAKNYGGRIIERLSDEIKGYYDIQILIDSNNNESEIYPIIGYKHKTNDALVWKQ